MDVAILVRSILVRAHFFKDVNKFYVNTRSIKFAIENKHYKLLKEMFDYAYPFLSNPIDGVITIRSEKFDERIFHYLGFLFKENGEYIFDFPVHTIALSGISLSLSEVVDDFYYTVNESRVNSLCDFIKTNPLIHTIQIQNTNVYPNEAKKILLAL